MSAALLAEGGGSGSQPTHTIQTIGAGVPSPGLVSVIKFFPLAFCMVDESGHLEVADSIKFAQFSSIGPDQQRNIAVTKNHLVHLGMPELPRQDHIVLGGRTYSDSVTTVYPNERSAKSKNTRILTTRWEGGDSPTFPNLHAFAEIAERTEDQP